MPKDELTEPERRPNVTVTQHVTVTQQILRTESELGPDYQMVTYWPYENTRKWALERKHWSSTRIRRSR